MNWKVKTNETISDSQEWNLRLWYSCHVGPPPCRSSQLDLSLLQNMRGQKLDKT